LGNVEWGGSGNVTISGGQVYVGEGNNLNQSSASPIVIKGGTFSIGPSNKSGTSTFELLNAAGITVNQNGTLDFSLPDNDSPLVSNNKAGSSIINNGTTYLIGTSNSGYTGSIGVVFLNHATLNADTGGSWAFTGKDASGDSLYMDAGTIFLMGGVSINCGANYTQTGGTLAIGDSEQETLTASTPNADNFNGGKIVFDSQTGYGKLQVNNVIFNGVELDMRIDGTTSAADQIFCNLGDVCAIKGISVLKVTAVNAPKQLKDPWILIKANGTNTITGDFTAPNLHLPANVKEVVPDPRTSWQCQYPSS
jgi:hypothetical protein